jgi:mono/diheme cytochrome c family protein
MKTFVSGLVVGILIFPVLFVLIVATGHVPAATADSPLPFERTIAGMALHARIRRQAPKRDVSSLTAANLVSGANVYQKNCAFCHGLPDQPKPLLATGMFPPPPQLFMADDGVMGDPAGEVYWKVKNGIRLTGMPAFQTSLSDEQMWQVTALAVRADKLPIEAVEVLKPAPSSSATSAGAPPPAQVPSNLDP